MRHKWKWDWPHISDWLYHHETIIVLVLLGLAFLVMVWPRRKK